ncbi:MAG TPA: hydrogen gas-evolving membrane-bound hydrogenase subunit E [Dehalococcoidia bacterium]|nr:hydrogen gas-evolving membrane-bound hydrogenase subunit E [Dehalococcoidia bacterium]
MRKVVGLILLLVVVAFLVWGVLLIHPFGYPPSDMDDYIIENAQKETASNNVVTSVVFDYRLLDTLGEATILFTAVMGVLLLLRTLKRREESS